MSKTVNGNSASPHCSLGGFEGINVATQQSKSSVKAMSIDALASEWLACERYINDPDPGATDRLTEAYERQAEIEAEQKTRIYPQGDED